MRKGSRFMPKAVNHVAVTVTDIRKAMKWYRDVMGMTVLAEPMEISGIPLKEKDKHISNLVRTVFGQNLGKFLICHLVSSNGVGIELFEFIEPKTEKRRQKKLILAEEKEEPKCWNSFQEAEKRSAFAKILLET